MSATINWDNDHNRETYRVASCAQGGLLFAETLGAARYVMEHAGGNLLPDDRPAGSELNEARAAYLHDNPYENRQQVNEAFRRMGMMTGTEISAMASDMLLPAERRALAWVALCRTYALAAAFAGEVLRPCFAHDREPVTRALFDRLARTMALWHPEVEPERPAVAAACRNLLRAAREAELLDGDDRPRQLFLYPDARALFDRHPESYEWLPMYAGRD